MGKALGIFQDLPAMTAFRPDANVTRAELAALLVRGLAVTLINPATASFRDVRPTHWHYRAVETARARGLMSGGGDGNFRPDAPVTRAELAAFVANAAKWPAASPATPSFTDVPRTYWAYSRVETASGWCRTVEARDLWKQTFLPASPATRAEAAAAVARMTTCLTGSEVK